MLILCSLFFFHHTPPTEIYTLSLHDALPILRRRVQMIFQDPYSSLNPRMSVRDTLAEPLAVHGVVSGRTAQAERIDELLRLVGLNPAFADRFPHEFSGGQRQRIGFARALAVAAARGVCHEPVCARRRAPQAHTVPVLTQLPR